MPTPTDGLIGGEWDVSAALEIVLERPRVPEWHGLRLFGRGRHPGTFAAGAETDDRP
jgi:hypothetical protein